MFRFKTPSYVSKDAVEEVCKLLGFNHTHVYKITLEPNEVTVDLAVPVRDEEKGNTNLVRMSLKLIVRDLPAEGKIAGEVKAPQKVSNGTSTRVIPNSIISTSTIPGSNGIEYVYQNMGPNAVAATFPNGRYKIVQSNDTLTWQTFDPDTDWPVIIDTVTKVPVSGFEAKPAAPNSTAPNSTAPKAPLTDAEKAFINKIFPNYIKRDPSPAMNGASFPIEILDEASSFKSTILSPATEEELKQSMVQARDAKLSDAKLSDAKLGDAQSSAEIRSDAGPLDSVRIAHPNVEPVKNAFIFKVDEDFFDETLRNHLLNVDVEYWRRLLREEQARQRRANGRPDGR